MKKIIHNIAAAGLVLSFILVLGAAGASDCGEGLEFGFSRNQKSSDYFCY